jgi:predicted MFS family arabinose efflux permease
MLGLAGFSASLTMRAIDPMVPLLSAEFGVSVETIALLSTAYALFYALGQPFLGPLGDARGKGRVMALCLFVCAACLWLSAFAPGYTVLLILRAMTGVAAGGLIPLSLALIGDRFPLEKRQVAISQYLVAVLSGSLLGAPAAGLLSEFFGWRPVIALSAVVMTITSLLALRTLMAETSQPHPFSISTSLARYRSVFANPKAAVCFSAVFIEGIVIFGLFPFVAALLISKGAGGVKEAGFVIGGVAAGGALFSLFSRPLLAAFGQRGLMTTGGVLALLGYCAVTAAPSWPLEALAFLAIGSGFYMLHSALQTEATELSPQARGSAVALHAFFFFAGQALGPIIYGVLLPLLGTTPTVLLAGVIMFAVCAGSAFLLTRIEAQRPR